MPITVSNLSDDPTVSGSLPYAIAAANSNPNPGTVSVIVFAIPQSLANTDGTFTIPLKSTDTPLTITVPVIIDATTQFNYAGIPLVEIDGENNGGNDPFAGLTLGPYAQGTNLGSTITGLAIVGFGKAGIDIESNKNVVTSDLIGVVPGVGNHRPTQRESRQPHPEPDRDLDQRLEQHDRRNDGRCGQHDRLQHWRRHRRDHRERQCHPGEFDLRQRRRHRTRRHRERQSACRLGGSTSPRSRT